MFKVTTDGNFDQSVYNLEKERKILLLEDEGQWCQKIPAI